MRIRMVLLSFVYFLGAVLVSASPIGRILPVKVVYRVIYIPLSFWAITVFYSYLFCRIKDRGLDIPRTLALGMILHPALLLLSSYFSVVIANADIGPMYKVYIESALYLLVALSLMWGIRAVRRDPLYLPVMYLLPYAFYLGAGHGDLRAACIFALIGAAVLVIDSSRRISVFLKGVYGSVKKIFGPRRNMLAAIFILAFLLRLLFGINIICQTKEAFPTASDDGSTYDRYACEMAKDPSYMRNAGFTPTEYDTGYSFVLGLLYRIFGRSFYLAVILQSLAGSFVPVMVYLLSEMAVKRKAVSLLAGIWCSLDQSLIMYSAVLGQEAFYIPLVTFLVYLVTRYAIQRKEAVDIPNSLLIGASFGAAVVIRSAILLFLPLVIIYLLSLRGGKGLVRRSVDMVIIICVAAAMIAPVTCLNYMNSGKPYLLTKPKPILEWDFPDGDGYYFPGNTALARIGVNPFKDPGGSAAKIAGDPLKFLAIEGNILARRYVGFFFCYNFGYFDPVFLINSARIPNDFASNLEFYIALAVFAGFLLIITDRDRRRKAWPMLLLVFYYVLIHVVITRMGSSRYRAPVHPYLIIFGAVGIVFFIDYVRKGLKRAS